MRPPWGVDLLAPRSLCNWEEPIVPNLANMDRSMPSAEVCSCTRLIPRAVVR